MRVDVMSKAVETVKPNVAASEADAHAAEKIHHLVVMSGSQLTDCCRNATSAGRNFRRRWERLELIAREPEHRSNRDLRRARSEQECNEE